MKPIDPHSAHPLIQKTARAISDWQSEYDWFEHTDQAIRCVEVISECLRREGMQSASDYLRSVIKEPSKKRQKETSFEGYFLTK